MTGCPCVFEVPGDDHVEALGDWAGFCVRVAAERPALAGIRREVGVRASAISGASRCLGSAKTP